MGRPVEKQRSKRKKNAGDERKKQINDKFLCRLVTWGGSCPMCRHVVTRSGDKQRGPGLAIGRPTKEEPDRIRLNREPPS